MADVLALRASLQKEREARVELEQKTAQGFAALGESIRLTDARAEATTAEAAAALALLNDHVNLTGERAASKSDLAQTQSELTQTQSELAALAGVVKQLVARSDVPVYVPQVKRLTEFLAGKGQPQGEYRKPDCNRWKDLSVETDLPVEDDTSTVAGLSPASPASTVSMERLMFGRTSEYYSKLWSSARPLAKSCDAVHSAQAASEQMVEQLRWSRDLDWPAIIKPYLRPFVTEPGMHDSIDDAVEAYAHRMAHELHGATSLEDAQAVLKGWLERFE